MRRGFLWFAGCLSVGVLFVATAGLIVLVSFIAPFRNERRMARELFPKGTFQEVFVDTPIEECERRDVKGLYSLARQGKLKNFTGIDSPYEAPEAPEVRVETLGADPEACAEQIFDAIDRSRPAAVEPRAK